MKLLLESGAEPDILSVKKKLKTKKKTKKKLKQKLIFFYQFRMTEILHCTMLFLIKKNIHVDTRLKFC